MFQLLHTLCCAHHKCNAIWHHTALLKLSLTIFSMLCLLFLWLIHSITGNLYLPLPFTHIGYPPPPSSWQPSICSLYLWVWFWFLFAYSIVLFFQISHMSKIMWYLWFSVWLISLKIISLRGTWVALSVKRPTLGFGSGHYLTFCKSESNVGLCAGSVESAWDSLSLPLSPPPPHLCCLYLSQNK